ncbi:hypothetical protein Hdeb2414_s0001g00010021 [Helianthus debilis subsp. tardiflorus]
MRNSVFYRPLRPNSNFKQLTNALYPIIHDETSFLASCFRLSNIYVILILALFKSQLFTSILILFSIILFFYTNLVHNQACLNV